MFSLLSEIKEHCQTYLLVEKESKPMSMCCVSLMALFGRLANKTTAEENSKQMLENADNTLKEVHDLIMQSNMSSQGLQAKPLRPGRAQSSAIRSGLPLTGLRKWFRRFHSISRHNSRRTFPNSYSRRISCLR